MAAKGMVELDREFEDKIMKGKSIGRREYDAAWEVYNSQPLFGGSIEKTIKLIEHGLEIAESQIIVDWLNEYKKVMKSK